MHVSPAWPDQARSQDNEGDIHVAHTGSGTMADLAVLCALDGVQSQGSERRHHKLV